MNVYTKLSGPTWADVSPDGLVTLTDSVAGTHTLTVQVASGVSTFSKDITLDITPRESETTFFTVEYRKQLGIVFDLVLEVGQSEAVGLAIDFEFVAEGVFGEPPKLRATYTFDLLFTDIVYTEAEPVFSDIAFDLVLADAEFSAPLALLEITEVYTVTQSSSFASGLGITGFTGTYASLTDNDNSTGAFTGATNDSWIQVTFAAPEEVAAIAVGGGFIVAADNPEGFVRDCATSLNGAQIQYSLDGLVWTDIVTMSSITDGSPTPPGGPVTGYQELFSITPAITARYWRLYRSDNDIGTSTLKFFAPA